MRPRQKQHWGAASFGLVFMIGILMMAPLRGAIIYTDVPDVNLMAGGFGGEASYDVDLNGDGTVELTVFSRFGDFGVLASSHTRIAGIPSTPPNSNGFAHPFTLGQIIGVTPPDDRSWNEGSSGLLGCQSLGCIGLWTTGGTNYIGVEFQIGPDLHYGWVEIDMQFIFAGGHLRSYAYESESTMSIVAGAIPEPSTGVLIGLGCAMAVLKRRRKPRRGLTRRC